MPSPSPLRLQTASLYVSSYTAVFAGLGGPFGYSPETGQFGGIISSAGLAQEPFEDSLTGVMAGDVITFVTVVENTGAAALYGLLLRNALPPGFTTNDLLDISLTDGAGDMVAFTGNLFDNAGGLVAAATAGYNADNGRNILLLTYTVQVPSQVAIPLAALPSITTLVQYQASPGGPPVLAGISDGTPVVSAAPVVNVAGPGQPIALGATGTFLVTISLPEGLITDLRLDDLLSPNLLFVSASVQRTGYRLSGVTPVLSGTSLRLGTVLDRTDGLTNAQDQLVVAVVARATAGGAAQLTATLSAADPNINPGAGPRWSTTAMAPAIIAAPVLALSVLAPPVAQAGQVVSVQVTLRNTGAAAALSVYLTDQLGPGLTLVPGSITASGTVAAALPLAQGVRVGALAAGETLVMRLMATVGPDVLPGATLDVGANAFGLVSAGGTAVSADAPGTIAAVGPAVTLTPWTAAVEAGAVVSIAGTLQLPAGGTPDVRVTFTLPAGLRYVAGSAGAAAVVSGQAVTLSLGNVAGAATMPVSLRVRVDGSAALGAAAVGIKVTTGYASTAADVAALTVVNSAPVITGVPIQVAGPDTASLMPFAGVTVADANTAQTETATIRVDPGRGTLSGPGQYDPASGTLVLSGTAAAVAAGLAAVQFLPTRHAVPAGQVSTPDLTLTVSDGAGGVATAVTHLAITTVNSLPTLAGLWAGQQTTMTLPAVPFSALTLADVDAGQGATLTIRPLNPGVGVLSGALSGALSGPGTVAGVFQQSGTLAALQAAARALLFTPRTTGTTAFAVTLDDGAGGVVQDSTTSITVAAPIGYPVERFPLSPDANFLTIVGGTQQAVLRGETYHGPVSTLRSQFIYDGPNSIVIATEAPDVFIKSFSGTAAIRVSTGQNVIDAGQGSNFIIGGTGRDTFYLNGSEGLVAWDTIVNFHAGDQVTLFGFVPGVSTYRWADNDGAAGYTGRTIHAVLSGTGPVTASLTFAGATAADTARYGIGTGTINGLSYLAIESH